MRPFLRTTATVMAPSSQFWTDPAVLARGEVIYQGEVAPCAHGNEGGG